MNTTASNTRLQTLRNIGVFFFLSTIVFTNTVFCNDENYFFSEAEYEKIMNLIKDIDSKAYDRLKKCESKLGMPCIEKAADTDETMIMPGEDDTQGFPIIIMNPMSLNWPEDAQKRVLKPIVDWYNVTEDVPVITVEEQKYIMDMVKKFYPALYAEIVKVDPSGSRHVARFSGNGIALEPAIEDALPKFLIDTTITKLPVNELRFLLGHELGHYVLGHLSAEGHKIGHRTLDVAEAGSIREFRKGKKVGGQLSFKQTFQDSFQRSKEDEADRFAIVELGIPIEDGIALAKRWQANDEALEKKNQKKETFKRTHPLWSARIKHMQDLRSEVELRKARNTPTPPINWKKLAENYEKMAEDYEKSHGSN